MKQNVILLVAGLLMLALGIKRSIETWPRKPNPKKPYVVVHKDKFFLYQTIEGAKFDVYTSVDGEHWTKIDNPVTTDPSQP